MDFFKRFHLIVDLKQKGITLLLATLIFVRMREVILKVFEFFDCLFCFLYDFLLHFFSMLQKRCLYDIFYFGFAFFMIWSVVRLCKAFLIGRI